MAHTNQTPNYELSQFQGTDKPAWLVDYNGDMEKIDLGLKAAKDVADGAKAEADQGAIDIAAVTITANSADVKASGAISDLADVYDSTSTYNIGDYVIYNSILYRCIVAISVPESFDGNHWVRTTVEEIATQINSDLALIGVTKIISVYISKQQTVALAPSDVIFENVLEIGSLTTSIQPLHMWNTNNGQMYKAYANNESGRFQAGENIPIGNYIVIGTLYVA